MSIGDEDLAAILAASEDELEQELAREIADRTGPAISLVLQGSGLAGAYAWGVLETLYMHSTLRIGAISASGTAALTAAAFIDGLSDDDPNAPFENMKLIWGRLQEQMRKRDGILAGPLAAARATFGDKSVPTPYITSAEIVELLYEFFRFDHICDAPVSLFVSATNAANGRMRVFSGLELSPESFAASIADPLIMEAVVIEGAPYWEGSNTGSPAIFPLFGEEPDDLVIVLPIPDERPDIGTGGVTRRDRMSEIACLAGLSRELRSISFVTSMVADGRLDPNSVRRPNMHMIRIHDHAMPPDLFDASPDWIIFMRENGQQDTKRWLVENAEKIGLTSSIDQRELFL